MSQDVMVGSHGSYRWLMSGSENMNAVLRQCPEVVVGRYVAITSYDGGALHLKGPDVEAGWEIRGGIAYSGQIRTLADLPGVARFEAADLYQEWYVFEAPVNLGTRFHGNIFAKGPEPGRTLVFVNYASFLLKDPESREITDVFWKQLGALQPESYFGEGRDYLTFVSRNSTLFDSVLERVKSVPR